MNEETGKKVCVVEKIGKNQFEEFQTTNSQTTSIDSPITKNNIIIFKTSCTKGKSSRAETKELKMHLRLSRKSTLLHKSELETLTNSFDMRPFHIHQHCQRLDKCVREINLTWLSVFNQQKLYPLLLKLMEQCLKDQSSSI